MSLIRLKSKKEPLYTSKSIVNFDEDVKEKKLDTNETLKENSSLIIGEGAIIKGEIKEVFDKIDGLKGSLVEQGKKINDLS